MQATGKPHSKTSKSKKSGSKANKKPATSSVKPNTPAAPVDPSVIPPEIKEPTETLSTMYKDEKCFPEGENMQYTQEWNLQRFTSAEARERERALIDIEDYRKAAAIHKSVRQWAQQWIKPGMSDLFVAENIERKVREECEVDGVNTTERGMAFPCGLSVNSCAAHFTPNPNDPLSFYKTDDVVKIDFGVHVNGHLIDSAFTMTWDPALQPILDCSKDATNTGIKNIGVDVRLCDIGDAIEEVMSSYEVEIKGKTYQLQPVRNLSGHMVGSYAVHAGKSIPICKGGPQTKMEEGEVYALETFATTGRGRVDDSGPASHYMVDANAFDYPVRDGNAKRLLHALDANFKTLAFCRRYVDKIGFAKWQMPFKFLVDDGCVNAYPPLSDCHGSYVAQFEHAIYLKPTCKEVLSRGFDY
uniref:Methionine aminopeptidase 2 n=1 Tax=Entamoeba histolytica TaxID=5759 RepID=A0A060N572_ENTHI|nr:methionine aminopeptidase, putative [Entamoeba histolytica]